MINTPTLAEFSERMIVGMGKIGEQTNLGDVWPALFNRINEINDRLNQIETIGLIKRNEHGYLAGVETSIQSEVPEGMYS
jgi:hypothetical protein